MPLNVGDVIDRSVGDIPCARCANGRHGKIIELAAKQEQALEGSTHHQGGLFFFASFQHSTINNSGFVAHTLEGVCMQAQVCAV